MADWHQPAPAYVLQVLPPGWTLHGTVTKNRSTYPLAWGRGMTAACDRHGRLVTLTGIERSRISIAVEFRRQPEWEHVPEPPPADGGWRVSARADAMAMAALREVPLLRMQSFFEITCRNEYERLSFAKLLQKTFLGQA